MELGSILSELHTFTERELKAQGVEHKVGKLPFVANGKAVASNEKDGFVKIRFYPDFKRFGLKGGCLHDCICHPLLMLNHAAFFVFKKCSNSSK